MAQYLDRIKALCLMREGESHGLKSKTAHMDLALLFLSMAISSGNIGRVWDEGFRSDLGLETSIVLILGEGTGISPYAFCYLRLKTNASVLCVGDKVTWKRNSVWLESRWLEKTIELEKIGPSFIKYDTGKSFMISEWKEFD